MERLERRAEKIIFSELLHEGVTSQFFLFFLKSSTSLGHQITWTKPKLTYTLMLILASMLTLVPLLSMRILVLFSCQNRNPHTCVLWKHHFIVDTPLLSVGLFSLNRSKTYSSTSTCGTFIGNKTVKFSFSHSWFCTEGVETG